MQNVLTKSLSEVETASAVIAVLGDKEMYKSVENVYKSAFEAGYMDEENMNRLIEGTKIPIQMQVMK